jgi:hypothetical protein
VDESSADIKQALVPHRELIALFASGAIQADQFEARYLLQYKADSTEWPADLFTILDGLFFDVDDFVSDDKLREQAGGLDASQLRERARDALRRLDAACPA